MNTAIVTFNKFLENAFDKGKYATDDVIAFLIPLFEEVLSFHEKDLVAPFEIDDTLFITDGRLDIDETFAHSSSDGKAELEKIFLSITSKDFEITGKSRLETDVDQGHIRSENLQVHWNTNELPTGPAYIRGYSCFEILVKHHDVQTDIFCLGLILGSMALGLDLYDEEELKIFAEYRQNPVQHNDRIHPTLSSLITEMTELDRAKRTRDLYDVMYRLKHYREYDPAKETDLSGIPGWVTKEIKERNHFILNKLRNRLFDTSRRNRLLYYKPNMRFVNLTVSSVPMVLHYQSIRPELLFTWNTEVSSKVKGMNEIVLNKFLRFEDHAYLPSSLDKIRVESQRAIQEYGFSQLKLVIAFLNWHNLKENAAERIQSPLLLIPVELKKTKRLKEDHYTMKVLDNAAQVNPIVANQLRELYGIKLPDFVDLDDMTLEEFYNQLKSQIDSANQGIQLHYINKPRIKLIHSVAKQTIGNYSKRIKRQGNQLDSYKNISYSYQQEHYKPLGLEIFKQRVEPHPTFLEFLVNEDIKLAPQNLTGNEKERELFEMTQSEENPYSWDFDLCNIVLGNFNYKKMSLVRDYNQVVDNNIQNPVFDLLFSNQPKQSKDFIADLNRPDDWYHVITADPAQTKAILQSRTNESYIIQGPPGTGKSQTITNLIADFVARGKSVLFICEKRAALDVVHHRLKQNGLDELCCYIHDSQADKREFVKNLKSTYEDFTKNKLSHEEINRKRSDLLNRINEQLQILNQYHKMNGSVPDSAGILVRSLVDRIVELKDDVLNLSVVDEELLPKYKAWIQTGEVIKNLCNELDESGFEGIFSEHPFSKLSDNILGSENPYTKLENIVQQASDLLTGLIGVLRECEIPQQFCEYLEQLGDLAEDAIVLKAIADAGNLKLIDPANESAKEFDSQIRQYAEIKAEFEKAKEKNLNWISKLNEVELEVAIDIVSKHEKSFFRFLNGDWRKLKKQINQCYDFSKLRVKVPYQTILSQLKGEYETGKLNDNSVKVLKNKYRLENIDQDYNVIDMMRKKIGDKEIDFLIAHPSANDIVKKVAKLETIISQLRLKLREGLYESNRSLSTIKDDIENILLNADSLRSLSTVLKDFTTLSGQIKQALRKIKMNPLQAEASIAKKTFNEILRSDKVYASINEQTISKASGIIKQCYEQLLKLNAELIRSSVRRRFITNVELSNTAPSQLNSEQKIFKKNYNEGRKILENEFGKSMRYKSIRELSTKESGLILKDIKPVWLMSPLSVSDSLPINKNNFDVVIFDEASQITLEEGIPALYRSPQTIIVGDDKQMPPTNFFTAKAEDPDDLEIFSDEKEEEILNADADSLLVQGVRKLNSTMLSWHYRSRYETLISYSNHAFYDARLLTIPDQKIHQQEKETIEVLKPEDAIKFIDKLFDRSISFHYQTAGIYEKRSNVGEANYIAHLVRELLKRKSGESIGIVAFSQEQQQTIEDALTELTIEDKEFEALLEEAYHRTEDDQFVGLIIKNLENIQGDERDIIIMSVCYGFDSQKKMIMNFGPINKKGGEKRLNVIFSRAKKHMAIVSSIKFQNITNEYNVGANYFRRFLQYAENVSIGNMNAAQLILDNLVLHKHGEKKRSVSTIVTKQIKHHLEKEGFFITEQVGQSDFKCSLAVKLHQSDEYYALSILIDDEQYYSNQNLLEQYFQRPAILQQFGWRIVRVFAKDWLQQPDKVLALIRKGIHNSLNLKDETQDVFTLETELSEKSEFLSIPGITPTTSTYDNLKFDRLEFKDSTSNKFWEATVEENKLIVRFGRIGTKGQLQIKSFAIENGAKNEKEKMLREKIAKGYVRKD